MADVGRQALKQESGRCFGGLRRVETARAIFRDAERVADEDEQKKIAEWARGSQSSERLKAMWTLAKADLAVSPEELDTDPMLLNVENGTVDLRTGSLRPHLPGDLIAKLAPVEFDPAAQAPRFYKFLKQILVEEELIAFVQRFLGYSLTGSTKERSLAVLHGVGKNGKSTLVELFQDMLGDYASTTKPDTVMQQRYGGSRDYYLAELAGVRFLAISETKRGEQLDEATVKQVTGGDTISAWPIYGIPLTYRPQFTIWMSTNHKPEIPDGSEAIWDRLRLIPFTQRFDGKRADEDLPEKLREKLSGVLAWAVTGCVTWYREGLGSSKAVDDATAAYRSETDVLDRFFEDECQFGPKLQVPKSELFEAWERWCDGEGEEAGTKTAFGSMVKERGIVKGFSDARLGNGTRIWVGVATTPPSDGDRVEAQKSWKQGGIVESTDTIDSNSQTILDSGLMREGLEKGPNRVERVGGENIPPVCWYEVHYHDASKGE